MEAALDPFNFLQPLHYGQFHKKLSKIFDIMCFQQNLKFVVKVKTIKNICTVLASGNLSEKIESIFVNFDPYVHLMSFDDMVEYQKSILVLLISLELNKAKLQCYAY